MSRKGQGAHGGNRAIFDLQTAGPSGAPLLRNKTARGGLWARGQPDAIAPPAGRRRKAGGKAGPKSPACGVVSRGFQHPLRPCCCTVCMAFRNAYRPERSAGADRAAKHPNQTSSGKLRRRHPASRQNTAVTKKADKANSVLCAASANGRYMSKVVQPPALAASRPPRMLVPACAPRRAESGQEARAWRGQGPVASAQQVRFHHGRHTLWRAHEGV